jgi:AcrR family transcriptional regulator
VYRHFPTKEALFEAVDTARVESLVGDARARADAADPGQAFFAFLARIGREAAAKRDLPDAITITGPLQQNLFAAVDVLLHRAQQAGAVRTDISTADLFVLVKGLITSIQEASADAPGPRLSNLAFALLSDGLRTSEGGRRGNGDQEDSGERQDK